MLSIKATKEKTKPVPKELPSGWKLDGWAKEKVGIGYRAINAERHLQTLAFATEAEMIASAHEIEAGNQNGLLGLAPKGVKANSIPAVEDSDPTLEKALHSALHRVQGASERWEPLILNGATDAELMVAIGDEFGRGGGSTAHGGYAYRGGKKPEFAWPNPANMWTAQILKGERLLAKVREVLEIGAPGAENCILCGDPVRKGHICDPAKSPKPLVEPSLVCACGHRADTHAPFNSPDEPPQECVECDCDKFGPAPSALNGTPFPAKYGQEELNGFMEYCAARNISERKPVKICYISGEPHVITGAVGIGDAKNWQEVSAWPILPLDNVGEENAKTYSQAVASGVRGPEFYKNVKVNCGSAKNPKWWVMVGPQMVFSVKAEDAEEGFHPGFPPGFDPERSSNGLGQAGEDDREQLREEALARRRREKLPEGSSASNGHYPQMLQMIPIDQIEPSPTNPRKYFDPAKLRELADSIIEHGLIEPITVRPIDYDANSPPYQLVAGERRWRAVKLAGLTKIEAKVRDLDDKAVLEIQFIENLQRSDLSAIEEADGYKRLLDQHGYTAESLAAKLGKSKSYIYARLKICNLPERAMEALAKGDISATVGELIGRLPSMEMRQEFWDEEFTNYGSQWFEQPSFRGVKLTIERMYMKELKRAPFNQKDVKLLPEAGSCTKCPFRTGNNKAEYPDSRADICTKPPCYDQKVEAFSKRKLATAATDGARVLTDEESEKYLGYGFLRGEMERDYIDLADECYEAAPEDDEETIPTYGGLLGGAARPEIVGMDRAGQVHQLVSRKAAQAALAEKGIELSALARTGSDRQKEERKRREAKRLRQATAAGICAEALEYLECNILADVDFLRLMARLLIEEGGADVARAIAKRREIEYTVDVRDSVQSIVDGLDDSDVPGLIVEWLIQRELEYWATQGSDRERFAVCEHLGYSPKAMLRAAETRAKQMAKSKPKTKAKAAARA